MERLTHTTLPSTHTLPAPVSRPLWQSAVLNWLFLGWTHVTTHVRSASTFKRNTNWKPESFLVIKPVYIPKDWKECAAVVQINPCFGDLEMCIYLIHLMLLWKFFQFLAGTGNEDIYRVRVNAYIERKQILRHRHFKLFWRVAWYRNHCGLVGSTACLIPMCSRDAGFRPKVFATIFKSLRGLIYKCHPVYIYTLKTVGSICCQEMLYTWRTININSRFDSLWVAEALGTETGQPGFEKDGEEIQRLKVNGTLAVLFLTEPERNDLPSN